MTEMNWKAPLTQANSQWVHDLRPTEDLSDFKRRLDNLVGQLEATVNNDPYTQLYLQVELDNLRIVSVTGSMRLVIAALEEGLNFASGKIYQSSFFNVRINYAGTLAPLERIR